MTAPWSTSPARRAVGVVPTLGLALCGLTLATLTSVSAAQGLVPSTRGLALSPGPGEAPAMRLQGGLALRLEQVTQAGQTWQHLLASDGSHGWAALAIENESPVMARAVGVGLELLPVPPGHPDFMSALGQPVSAGAQGHLLGGSRDSQVADMQDRMLPAWLNPGLAPWPRWKMGDVDGWAPLQQVALDWQADHLPADSSARNALGAWGLFGLSRAPFLAPLMPVLKPLAPGNGVSAVDVSGAPGKAHQRSLLNGVWEGPLVAYRATVAPVGGLAALLSFGQGKARAFVLQGTSNKTSVITADDDSLSIVRLEEFDLDGDGLPEWVLELAGLYGDGYYTELWVVDGRSTQGSVRIQRQALSRSSGETPASAQDAAWAIGSDRTLWVWRSSASGSRMAALRYGRGRLSAAAGMAPALVVLGDDDNRIAAQQRQLQLQNSATAPEAVVLPRQTLAGLRWVTAVPTASMPQARRWATDHALPLEKVRKLPWAPS
jgi:hypothetical protein